MAPCTILLVAESDTGSHGLLGGLSDAGLEAMQEPDWPRAQAAMAREAQLEIVLLDADRRQIDALESLRWIRKNHPLLEVILLASQPGIAFAVSAIKAGAFHLLAKPLIVGELLPCIGQAGLRKRAREQALFEARSKPYCSERERQGLIARILAGADATVPPFP